MTAPLDLDALKAAALAANPGTWWLPTSDAFNDIIDMDRCDFNFIAAASPAVMLELLARLETAEAGNAILRQQSGALHLIGHAIGVPAGEDVVREVLPAVKLLLERAPNAANIAKQKQDRIALVKRFVKIGDVLTHSGCCGIISEHEFTGWDGAWMCGRPTPDTFRFNKMEGRRGEICNSADDIAPDNVTHINRVPVSEVKFLAVNAGGAA